MSKSKASGFGTDFDMWWAQVRADYKSHESETVAKAAWVTAWNSGRRYEQKKSQAKPLNPKEKANE